MGVFSSGMEVTLGAGRNPRRGPEMRSAAQACWCANRPLPRCGRLTQMNVQLDKVISNIVGETGQKIVRAILAGERDALSLAKLRHGGIRASQEQIVKSLQGSWREEHLFSLKQAVNLYDS